MTGAERPVLPFHIPPGINGSSCLVHEDPFPVTTSGAITGTARC
jgi:hypothetical protein